MTDLERFGLILVGFAFAVVVGGALFGLVGAWITRREGMRIFDRDTWEDFVYMALYPAILGSLLYDALHFYHPWDPFHLIGLSITALYVIDCLHVYAHWRGRAKPSDIVANALIAIALGIAYWLATDRDHYLRLAYIALALITSFELVLNRFIRKRQLLARYQPSGYRWVLRLDGWLIAVFLAAAWWLGDRRDLTWTVAWVCSLLPTVAYAGFVLSLPARAAKTTLIEIEERVAELEKKVRVR